MIINGINNKDNVSNKKISKEELNSYDIDVNKEAIGIYKDDISIPIIINDCYRKIFYNDEEDITIYSIVSRKCDNYEYIPYVTSKLGLECNFYNIEKEYHRLAYMDSFIYHDIKSYDGYLLSVLELNNHNILNILLGDKKKKDKYEVKVINDIDNVKDVISYIFSINKYKKDSYELIDQDKCVLYEIKKCIKIIKSKYDKLISFYEINDELTSQISSFSINTCMWCLEFNKYLIIIDCGTYE